MDEPTDVLPIYDHAYQEFFTKYPKANEVNAHAYARMVCELSNANIRHQEITEKLEKIADSAYYG